MNYELNNNLSYNDVPVFSCSLLFPCLVVDKPFVLVPILTGSGFFGRFLRSLSLEMKKEKMVISK